MKILLALRLELINEKNVFFEKDENFKHFLKVLTYESTIKRAICFEDLQINNMFF